MSAQSATFGSLLKDLPVELFSKLIFSKRAFETRIYGAEVDEPVLVRLISGVKVLLSC